MLLCAGGTSSPPEEGGERGGGASTKDLVRVWSSLIFAEEMYRAFRVIEQRAHCKMYIEKYIVVSLVLA